MLFSHFLDFVKLLSGYKNGHISEMTSQILVRTEDFSFLVIIKSHGELENEFLVPGDIFFKTFIFEN